MYLGNRERCAKRVEEVRLEQGILACGDSFDDLGSQVRRGGTHKIHDIDGGSWSTQSLHFLPQGMRFVHVMEHVLTEDCGEGPRRNWQPGNPALHELNALCKPGATHRLVRNREHGL